jgi:hypothetical protein
MSFGYEKGSRDEASPSPGPAGKPEKAKKWTCDHNFAGPHIWKSYVSCLFETLVWLAPLGRETLSHLFEPKMYNVKYHNTNLASLAISESGVAYTTYFADQEPIDGKLTVVDLTEGSCRWPTGNPRDLSTFRYCGATAHSGPYCDRHAQLAYMPRLPRAA